ncbi:TetR/AcrR family transcriptional regulator [Chitinophaga sp. HK235]|uniref:TetR/AcrR family transcriptional regulator n=1 Tax=Chitinophaga sp. HK235 TaxID=2952571 RepID=UPI0021137120|nr:TetR/AcrR family transcriptional regulator [Chitinophaga sp. HK235]
MAEQDQKRTLILEAALKRFKRFGLSKTTMEEIARDLEISKGSLYYYFSDKESIYVAVVERMIADCFFDMSAYVEEATSTDAIINRYLELKERMLVEYHFLFGINEWIKDVPSSRMRQTIELLQTVEVSFLSATIRRGISIGELNEATDPEATAQLLVNVLFGLWVIWCKWQATGFDPHDRNGLRCFMERERQVLYIFFNGLRYKPTINQDRHSCM